MSKFAISRILLVLTALSTFSLNVFACTMFKITEDGKTIVGNNEDWSNPHSRIWFEVGGDGEFGVAYVGFDDLNPQGAFNEAGLVYDIFAMPYEEITEGKHKKPQSEDFLKTVMRSSATVDEVKVQLEAHNLEGFEQVMLLYVDKSGKYLIQERDKLTSGDDARYVLSNFSPTKVADHSSVALPHFQKGRALLDDHADLSLDFCESMLNALHQDVPFWGGTQYSTLYNLTDGKIDLYYFHDYNQSVRFDLKEELEKGNHVLKIPEMFPDVVGGHKYLVNYDEYQENLLLLENDKTFSDPETLSRVTKKIVGGPPKKMIYANYYKIEKIGNEWLQKGNYDNAISVFSINAGVFDWIVGPFANLAHAYMLDGQYDMAITNYEKVLEISPGDENAASQLRKINLLQSKSEEG